MIQIHVWGCKYFWLKVSVDELGRCSAVMKQHQLLSHGRRETSSELPLLPLWADKVTVVGQTEVLQVHPELTGNTLKSSAGACLNTQCLHSQPTQLPWWRSDNRESNSNNNKNSGERISFLRVCLCSLVKLLSYIYPPSEHRMNRHGPWSQPIRARHGHPWLGGGSWLLRLSSLLIGQWQM